MRLVRLPSGRAPAQHAESVARRTVMMVARKIRTHRVGVRQGSETGASFARLGRPVIQSRRLMSGFSAMQNTALATMAIALASSAGAQETVSASLPAIVVSARVTTWQGDARAAYSLIHDDYCAGADGIVRHAVPELLARDLRAGIATVVGGCEWRGLTTTLAEFAAQGFEIVNHSYSHPHVTPDVARQEIGESKRRLEADSGSPVTFFAFPYDDFNDETLEVVADTGHLGSRAGQPGINPPDGIDPLRVRFEVFGPYSSYEKNHEGLNRYVDDTLELGGWGVRECHGVEDGSWEPVPLAEYRAHLDHVRAKVHERLLWMAPPSTVLRYQLARSRCGAPLIAEHRVSIAADEACLKLATPLTLALQVAGDSPRIVVHSEELELPTRLGPSGEWLVDIKPGQSIDVLVPD